MFYTNKHQNHVPCSYRYKLICVNVHFSKPLKPHLSEDAVYKFINNNLLEESIYCSCVKKEYFDKKLVMIKKMMKILRALLSVRYVIILLSMMMLLSKRSLTHY